MGRSKSEHSRSTWKPRGPRHTARHNAKLKGKKMPQLIWGRGCAMLICSGFDSGPLIWQRRIEAYRSGARGAKSTLATLVVGIGAGIRRFDL
ncbi:hypothetical protein PputUW4_01027 [Pseudomonas sp. UW4]|nr:hypothetical protein PputUW4_01027 [Pseudomonas sp. UW4]